MKFENQGSKLSDCSRSPLKSWPRVFKVLKDTTIALGVALGLLLTVELGIRFFFLMRLGRDEYLKYEYRHDPIYSVSNERELNSLGFRGKEFSVHKLKGVTRIILVGGSQVFGVYVPLEESLPVILERKLKETFQGREFEVINAGRLGSVAANEALLMEQLVNLEPDCVVVFNGWNDIYHARYLPDQYEKVMESTTKKFKWDRRLSRWFRRHLWSIRKIREWRDEIRKKQRSESPVKEDEIRHEWEAKLGETKQAMEKGEPMISMGWSGGYVHYPLSRLPKPSAVFRPGYYENLVRIARIAKNHHLRLIFIFQPDLGYHKLHRPLNSEEEEAFKISTRVFSKDWFETVKQFYPTGIGTMKEAALSEGIPFYDFSLILLSASQNGFGDTVHLNAFGNAVVADEMVKVLQLLLP